MTLFSWRDRWWVNAFFTGITPFLDPVTKDKVTYLLLNFESGLPTNVSGFFADAIQPEPAGIGTSFSA